MEYYKNLNGHFIKNRKGIIWGVLLKVVALSFCIGTLFYGYSNFYMIYSVVLFANGAIGIARSRGVMLLTKAYVKFDDESLEIKNTNRKRMLWKNIETIDFNDNKMRTLPVDKNFQFTSFSNLEDEVVEEIVCEISKMAKLKNIKVEGLLVNLPDDVKMT